MKMTGDFRATIVNPTHPQAKMKAQIKVIGYMEGIPDQDLPWAEYLLPVNYQFTPNNIGDLVWVDFPYDGDSRRPRIKGGAMTWEAEGKPNIAPEAGGAGKPYEPKDPGGSPARPTATSSRDTVISRNNILEVRTEGGGYTITNMKNGATVGFNEGGDLILIGAGACKLYSKGKMSIESGGDMELKAAGKMTQTAGGKYAMEAGSAEFKAGGFDFSA